MTTSLGAKPGQYIWDPKFNEYCGRLNKDGTEDRRFTTRGACSMMNTLLKVTGHIPVNPATFADNFSNPSANEYTLKGFDVILACVDLTPDLWAGKATEMLGEESDGMADLLLKVSQNKSIELSAKLDTLSLIVGEEVSRSGIQKYVDLHNDNVQRIQDKNREKIVEKPNPSREAYDRWRPIALELQELRPKLSEFRVCLKNKKGMATDKVADGVLLLLPFDCVSQRKPETFEKIGEKLASCLRYAKQTIANDKKAKDDLLEKCLELGRQMRERLKNGAVPNRMGDRAMLVAMHCANNSNPLHNIPKDFTGYWMCWSRFSYGPAGLPEELRQWNAAVSTVLEMFNGTYQFPVWR
jgi:hypothetical protein